MPTSTMACFYSAMLAWNPTGVDTELNPVENFRQFIRSNLPSNQVFASYDAIVDHCCDAWNRLADQPWRVMTLGLRNWATGHAT